MVEIICKNCGKKDEHHSKGYCFNCYRQFGWNRQLITCKRCGREKPNHAKGFCGGCYQFIFNLDKNKAWTTRKNYNLSMDTYKQITQKCIICGFDKVVDLHHVDQNTKNNSERNLVGLCPNHHKMLHDFRYRVEMLQELKNKGFEIPEDKKVNFKLR